MSIRQRMPSWLIVLSISAGVLVVGCSKPEIACGTVVKPKNATDFELQLIAIARAESENSAPRWRVRGAISRSIGRNLAGLFKRPRASLMKVDASPALAVRDTMPLMRLGS